MVSDTLIEIAKMAHEYVDLLTWPIVALVALFLYRDIIRSLLPGSKVKLTISGVTVETTLPTIEHSIAEGLENEKLTDDQWSWLLRLSPHEPTTITAADHSVLRPLRNSGLIRTHPKGSLGYASAIKITTLGTLLVEASGRK